MPAEARRTVFVKNLHGLHMRPAKGFMEEAKKFTCDVFVAVDGSEVNGKSILGLATLGAECGQGLEIRCVGEDAEAAADYLAAYVERFPEMFEEERIG